MTQPPAPSPSIGAEATGDSTQKLGRTLLTTLVRTLKVAWMHSLDNEAVNPIVNELVALVNPRLQVGEQVQLQCVGEGIFLNRQAIKLKGDAYSAAVSLQQLFKRMGVDEISFSEYLDAADVRDFLLVFQRYIQSNTPKAIVNEKFGKVACRSIKQAKTQKDTIEIDGRQNVLRAYASLAVGVNEPLEALKAGKKPSMEKLRRSVQGLVNASNGFDSLLVGLTRFDKMSGSPTFHATSVSALSILLGRKLGMTRTHLMELAMSALFHDLGRSELLDLGENPDMDAYEVAAKRVPLQSILHIARTSLSVESLERMAVAYEISLPVESPPGAPKPNGTSRIIAVPCAFDLMTNPPKGRKALMPDQALRIIQDHAGTRFDPRVVHLFASSVGLFPVGTTVELTGGELAVVMEVPNDPAKYALPLVKVIRDTSGPCDYVIDLSHPDEKLRIVKSVDAREEDINVPHFLLA
jgi:HD-GYP domain-containing protein (c-di-GMP phosphodiesterase class II)